DRLGSPPGKTASRVCRPALLAHLYWFVEAGLPAPHRERLRERPFEASATCFSARCQTRPGASSGGCVERVRKESQCPPKLRRVTASSTGCRPGRRSSATAGWVRSCLRPCRACEVRRRQTCARPTRWSLFT